MSALPPPPLDNAVEQADGRFSPPWNRWLQLLWDNVRGATVAARYTNNAAQTFPSATYTACNFGTKSIDTHGAVTSTSPWTFVVPEGQGGTYALHANILFAGLSGVTGEQRFLARRTRASVSTDFGLDIQATTFGDWQLLGGYSLLDLEPGDTVQVMGYQSTGGGTRDTQPDTNFNHVDIHRVG